MSEQFLEITYVGEANGCTAITPELEEWFITSFENNKIEIFLNFTNPIYVSSSDEKDEIRVKVKEPFIFQSLENNIFIKTNSTSTFYLPSMIDPNDREAVMKLTSFSKNSMLLT